MTPLATCRLLWFALAIAGLSQPAAALDLDDLPMGTVLKLRPQPADDGRRCLPAARRAHHSSGRKPVCIVKFRPGNHPWEFCVINKDTSLVDILPLPATPGATAVGLLGELWEDGSLYVLDQADNIQPHGTILKVNPRTHQVTTIANGFAFPNGIAEDRNCNFDVTDSFLGAIFELSKADGKVTPWFSDPTLILQNPNQPVAANDLAFDADEHFLYVDNAGNRPLLRVPIDEDGNPAKFNFSPTA